MNWWQMFPVFFEKSIKIHCIIIQSAQYFIFFFIDLTPRYDENLITLGQIGANILWKVQ